VPTSLGVVNGTASAGGIDRRLRLATAPEQPNAFPWVLRWPEVHPRANLCSDYPDNCYSFTIAFGSACLTQTVSRCIPLYIDDCARLRRAGPNPCDPFEFDHEDLGRFYLPEATGMSFILRIDRIIDIQHAEFSWFFYRGILGDLGVKLAFQTKDLRTLCESQLKAERAFGMEVARRLRGLLADLDTAETLQEIPVEELRESEDGNPDEFESPLDDCYVVRMRANHSGLDRSSAERIDRSTVRRLKIIDIVKIEVSRG
jgi:hypothetical protein